ncbi:efflux RND transporter permease subunit [Shimia sp. SDUM112013]|uniref:efflux RND transporter permease subunit n=1 Tax=Shimia sp. SDUM112013 TaxID=3136160 RepID=UPI0032EC7C9F
MIGIVDWAAERARMVMAFVLVSLVIGATAYTGLPKEGEPDIQIPALFVSVPFPGISAEDAEKLLVKPMETELADLDGLDTMSATAAENYAGLFLEFDFGWDKGATMADVREAMNTAEANFPEGYEKYSINEINFSEFPIIIVNLTGDVPERTMTQIANRLQDDLEALDSVLEAGLAGGRDEMLEVIIDPLRLESYNVTATELINVVRNNNQMIPAGDVETAQGKFAVKLPSSFTEPRDVYELPVKTNGDRIVTLGDLAQINLTFEDRLGTARFNGENTVALQVVKRKGFNLIDTAETVRRVVDEASAEWPAELQAAVEVGTSNDQSVVVSSMVRQLEGSVLTAVALVMIVVLAALGMRAALLVGFAIPTSFLLCFAFLAMMGVTISNMVMFGLILAVGMLVDGAIVVVEYADKRIKEGVGPMHAYVEAAKRMFWPIVSSTATTLCAFLPMLFWPGIPGQFMEMLPITLIFVLSASLVVALVYLPVLGGLAGRFERLTRNKAQQLAGLKWYMRILVFVASAAGIGLAISLIGGAFGLIGATFALMGSDILRDVIPGYLGIFALIVGIVALVAVALVCLATFMLSLGSIFTSIGNLSRMLWRKVFPKKERLYSTVEYKRNLFGDFIHLLVARPFMPLVAIASVFIAVGVTFSIYGANNKGVEFFVESEPEAAIIYVRARGNLSLEQQDDLVRQAEEIVLAHPGTKTAFAFAGEGGLNNNTGGAQAPKDTIGQVQMETIAWGDRPVQREKWFTLPLLNIDIYRDVKDPAWDGNTVLAEIEAELKRIPGAQIEILEANRGPASAKPVHLRLKGENWEDLLAAATMARAQFEATPGLTRIEDTLPLPGIDWQIDVDVAKAGRYGADTATVGAMVQLVTRGILLDTMRVDTSDEEIEIRVRLPDEDRVLSTLDTLKVRTADGLVPLSNFITRKPVEKLAEINRVDQKRYFDVKADVASGLTVLRNAETGETEVIETAQWDADSALQADYADRGFTNVVLTANERIAALTQWLEDSPFPRGIDWEWTGDQEDQAESQAFLGKAFGAALALMFIILLAQFNSFYNAVLVLLAVVLSTTGVLIGMLVMNQPFSIIMTGTGVVALAGIVVNNNIVLIDTYQEYSRYMPRIDAIVRTAQARIRPVLLTTITTMAGLAPMMIGLSLDFVNGGYSFESPTSLWWTQLATAVVFGLGIATILTLVFTPSMLAARVWFSTYLFWTGELLAKLSLGRGSRAARDWALRREARKVKSPVLLWEENTPEVIVAETPADATDKPANTNTSLDAAE